MKRKKNSNSAWNSIQNRRSMNIKKDSNYPRAVSLIVIPIHYRGAPFVRLIAVMHMFMVMVIQQRILKYLNNITLRLLKIPHILWKTSKKEQRQDVLHEYSNRRLARMALLPFLDHKQLIIFSVAFTSVKICSQIFWYAMQNVNGFQNINP